MNRLPVESASVLLTDFYQLTMLQGYFEQQMFDTAAFEFFVRKLPRERNFLIAAGLEQVLEFVEGLRFTPPELEWIGSHGAFRPAFVDYLANLRFSGDVQAMPEGTIFFPNQPILRVVAPLPQAQLVESRIINLLHFQTLIASKAVRAVLAGPDKLLVDFGLRRAHGAEAGLLAARASYLAGFAGSSTVLAAARFGLPAFGTMAHSFIQAHDDESVAFEHFARSLPQAVILLIDTYDTEAAAERVVRLAPRLRQAGIAIKGVRLDSGDLAEHARRVRRILDTGGLREVTIFASGNIDEHAIENMRAAAVPIDGFGVGTHMDTSADAPHLDCAYKIQEYAGRARRKRSEGKATWPGRKQVHRVFDPAGRMQAGRRLAAAESLATIRARVAAQVKQLPPALTGLAPAPPYPVIVAPALQRLADEVDARQRGSEVAV